MVLNLLFRSITLSDGPKAILKILLLGSALATMTGCKGFGTFTGSDSDRQAAPQSPQAAQGPQGPVAPQAASNNIYTGNPQLDAAISRARPNAADGNIEFAQIATSLLRGAYFPKSVQRPKDCAPLANPVQIAPDQVNLCIQALRSAALDPNSGFSAGVLAQLSRDALTFNGVSLSLSAPAVGDRPWSKVPAFLVEAANSFAIRAVAQALFNGTPWDAAQAEATPQFPENLAATIREACSARLNPTEDQIKACTSAIAQEVVDKNVAPATVSVLYLKVLASQWSQKVRVGGAAGQVRVTNCSAAREYSAFSPSMVSSEAIGPAHVIAANITVALDAQRSCTIEALGQTVTADPASFDVCFGPKLQRWSYGSSNTCSRAVFTAQDFAQCANPAASLTDFNFKVEDRGRTYDLGAAVPAPVAGGPNYSKADGTVTQCERRLLGIVSVTQPGPAPTNLDYTIASVRNSPYVYTYKTCNPDPQAPQCDPNAPDEKCCSAFTKCGANPNDSSCDRQAAIKDYNDALRDGCGQPGKPACPRNPQAPLECIFNPFAPECQQARDDAEAEELPLGRVLVGNEQDQLNWCCVDTAGKELVFDGTQSIFIGTVQVTLDCRNKCEVTRP